MEDARQAVVTRGVSSLTLRVSTLRDAEERSSTTPGLAEYLGLYQVHRVARILLLLALAAVVYNTLLWAWETRVWVPIAS